MGWAKTDEDIRDTIDSRMRDRCHSYHGNTYINYCPNYLSKKRKLLAPQRLSTKNTDCKNHEV